jgi:hypothetical protein
MIAWRGDQPSLHVKNILNFPTHKTDNKTDRDPEKAKGEYFVGIYAV